MSLITRCPACATTFKVVPDQLRISDGWVRCGQCTEVFDATANLVQEGDASPLATSGPAASRSHRPEPPAFLRAPAHSPVSAMPAPRPPTGSGMVRPIIVSLIASLIGSGEERKLSDGMAW